MHTAWRSYHICNHRVVRRACAHRGLHGGWHMRLAREQSKQSVVQVLDPQVYLRSVKKHLSEKQGLPAEHQRLTFAVAAALGKAEDPASLPGSAEGLLSGLDTWQALVYCNRKCIGKFTHPRLYSVSQLGDTSSVSSSKSCPVQQLTIIYDCFKAACSDSSARVSVPVVASGSSEDYKFTVVGRCEGCNFILPATYQFSSQQAAYELQKALYTSRHQQNQAAAAAFVTALSPLIAITDLTLNFGPSLSSSESSESVTPQQNQQPDTKPTKATQPTPSSKMPSTNHKPLSKKQKQKQNSRAAELANRHTDCPKSAASTAAKEERTASVHSNNQRQSKKLMAVPATSENQAAAVNGFSAQGALGAPSPEGLQSNGWAPTESGSSLAGSGTSPDASWQPAAPQQPTAASKPASDDSLDLQDLINEAVNHSQSQPRSALPNGQQAGTPSASAAASLASAGDAGAGPTDTDMHLGVQGVGMYAEPAAVQAWATDGAASSVQEQDTPASSSHTPQYPTQRSHLSGAQHHINGYASGACQGNPSAGQLGGIHPSPHSADYPGSSGSDHHWQDHTPELPPGLYQGTARRGSGAACLAPAVRDQAPVSDMGLPSYALPTYAKHSKIQQGSANPQPSHLGWAQSRQPGASVSARPTSSLQSLDLAHDSWQERRVGQSQHPYGQRWGKSGRPTAQGGGSATQPSSARVSPERSRDAHRPAAPQQQGFATGTTAQRPFTSAGSRHGEYPPSAMVADAGTESGLYSGSAVYRQGNAFHARSAVQLPREAAEVAVPASAAMADSRPVLTDWQRPAPVQSRDLAAATDIERLLQQLTPVMPGESQATDGLTLGHLWQWYLEPSLYGTEIVTLGGSRGPSVSYYVPYLSAMQLLLPLAPAGIAPSVPQQEPAGISSVSQPAGQPAQANSSEQHVVAQRSGSQQGCGDDAAQQMQEGVSQQQLAAAASQNRAGIRPCRVYHVENDGQVQPLIELFDTELPFNRIPMHDKVQELAAGRLPNGMPGSVLNSQPISELHPASWFSVAWYPAYRIPDAPLNGRFLTFHHIALRPAPESGPPGLSPELFSIARDPCLQADLKTNSAGNLMPTVDLPIAGLKLCNLHGERWLEPLSMDASHLGSSQLRSSNRGQTASSPLAILQHRLNALQHHAEYLARAQGLRLQGSEGLERLQQRHPDFEFFHTRH